MYSFSLACPFPNCNTQEFTTEQEFLEHHKNNHVNFGSNGKPIGKRYKCPFPNCDKVLGGWVNWIAHGPKKHHVKKAYTCNFNGCNADEDGGPKTCSSKYNIASHALNIHNIKAITKVKQKFLFKILYDYSQT